MKLWKRKFQPWRKYCATLTILATYVLCRNSLRSFTRSLKRSCETTLSEKVKHNPKAFWKYANSRFKTKETVHSLQLQDSNGTSHLDQDKANMLNTFFSCRGIC